MRISVLLILSVFLLTSCIDRYYFSREKNDNERPLVVYGSLTDQPGISFVEISFATDPGNPSTNEVANCNVELVSSTGLVYNYQETYAGRYELEFKAGEIDTTKTYYLRIEVPDRGVYESDPEGFEKPTAITSVYGERKDKSNYDGTDTIEGVQFYVDMTGNNTDGRYMRYEVIETWEDYSPFIYDAYYDGELHIGRGDALKHCYKTTPVNKIFTLNTAPLTENSFKGYKLQYVDNTTQRLYYKYTFLVRQLSISEKVWNFWETLKKNNQDNGGLYETQPSDVKGNIHKKESDEEVLGIFEVATLKEKRIYIDDQYGMKFRLGLYCELYELEMGFTPDTTKYPQYITILDGVYWTAHQICYDCRLRGGTLEPPDFWIWE